MCSYKCSNKKYNFINTELAYKYTVLEDSNKSRNMR
jgi:hypothetical protein